MYSESLLSSGKNRKRLFNLSAGEEEESASFNDHETTQMNGSAELDHTIDTGGDSMQLVQEDDDDDHDQHQQSLEENSVDEPSVSIQPPKRKGGRPRKNAPTGSQEAPIAPAANKKGGARGLKSVSVDMNTSQASVSAPAPKPGRGRPPKHSKLPSFEEEKEEGNIEDERPAKRSKSTVVNGTPRMGRPPKKTKPSPSQRDPNAKVISVKQAKAKAALVKPDTTQRNNGRPKPRSLYIMRSGTPADDSGSRTTRSGRTSVKPLAYWRNERIVYGEDDAGTNERYLLPTIKEVIRTEELEPPRPRKAKGRSRPATKKRQLEDVEEEDEEQEPWETEEGIIRGLVKTWNTVQGPDGETDDENGAFTTPYHPILSRIRVY